jgi:hypothetical protein
MAEPVRNILGTTSYIEEPKLHDATEYFPAVITDEGKRNSSNIMTKNKILLEE